MSIDRIKAVPFPVMPFVDESLFGLVFRAAEENVHQSPHHIICAAEYPYPSFYTASINHLEKLPSLAAALGLRYKDIAGHAHRALEWTRNGVQIVDFFGTPVEAVDLIHHRRRIAPSTFAKEPYHRAMWTIGLLPYCTRTGGKIIDACPECLKTIRWNRPTSPTLCSHCGVDFTQCELEEPSPEDRLLIDPFINLLHPDPAVHKDAFEALHPDLKGLGRSEVFELGWLLAAGLGAPIRDVKKRRKSFTYEDKMATLRIAATVISAWGGGPGSFLEQMRSLDGAALPGAVTHLRVTVERGRAWPVIRDFVREHIPEIFDTSVKSFTIVSQFSNQFLTVGGAREKIGISAEEISQLIQKKIIVPTHSATEHSTNILINAGSIDKMAAALQDRMSAKVATKRLSISVMGLEQLICLGLVDQITEDAVAELFPGLQVSGSSIDELLCSIRATALPYSGQGVSLGDAMKAIGGGPKPWGPVLKAMIAGELRYALRPGSTPPIGRIVMSQEDAEAISQFSFDEADYPDFAFQTMISAQDARELLNLNKKQMTQTTRGDLKHATGRLSRVNRAEALEYARHHMSESEVRHRFLRRYQHLPAELSSRGSIKRSNLTGWRRAEVVQLFAGKKS